MVTVRTGQISSAIGKDPKQWAGVVADWIRISAIGFPDDCRSLLQMREESRELKLWEAFGFEDEGQFFREKLFLNPEAVELACAALEIVDPAKPIGINDAVSKGAARLERNKRIHEKRATGMTQQAIADSEGISPQAVAKTLQLNMYNTDKVVTAPRNPNARTLNLSKSAERAAEQIRAKLGDEFADQLKESL